MPGKEFTVADLRRILRAATGAGEEIGSDAGVLDVAFEDLGFESLALLETVARIQREFGLRLEDSTLVETLTPRALIRIVNARLAVLETL
jgi:act minimal PKS acyl carrier protein